MDVSPIVKRLLILDDNEEINTLLRTIAEGEAFETCATTRVDEFFATLPSWQPSHIIVDLQLPDADGIQTLKQLARDGCGSNIIVTSGLDVRVLEAAAKIAAENGLRMTGVLPKPFTPGQVRQLLGFEPTSRGKNTFEGGATQTRISSAEFMEMNRAIDAGQFVPFFQPKISCRNFQPAGFECLARWKHPARGLVMPDHFIPLAERSGLIHRMSYQVFSRALEWFTASFRGSDLTLALNMSPILLGDDGFSLWLEEQCERHRVRPEQIILEITETSQLDNPGQLLEFLTHLRIRGFHLSIDDFGVGYSSLTQLARLPFSEMKIDKSFIMDAPSSQESQKIAVALVGLARSLGLSIIAEGVEDEWTLSYLRDIGCDRAQGYYIARPLDSDAALEWVERWRGETANA